MDSSISLLQKVETIAYISEDFGLYVRIVITFCKSQMAEQGKNNKIHYRTVILHLNSIDIKIDLLDIKNVSKTVQELFNNLSLNEI